jgi:pimeloyl-ACP methyl ester carboxylesterase
MTSPIQAGKLMLPGSALYYEARGSGPPLVLIPGGPTDAGETLHRMCRGA